MGALLLAKNEGEERGDRVRFTLRFAVQRLASLAGDLPLWKRVRLSPADELLANEIFEAAKRDASYTDDELVLAALTFVTSHGATAGLYGRLAADLEFLVTILRDRGQRAEDRETARAALTYFIVGADAVPDDLGPVGLVDDALVVHNAVVMIQPQRGAATALLDHVVARWPFVEELAFESDGQPYPASEFLVVNAALLLDEVRADGVTGAAVVVPSPGPLPFLCGFLLALAELRKDVLDDERPVFSEGERLRNRATGAEVEFIRYGRVAQSGALHPTSRDDASHFEYRTGDKQFRRQPVAELVAFIRSPRRSGKLGKGNLAFDPRSLTIGPLERLFGRTQPVALPPRRRRVIAVMDRVHAAELAGRLSLFGWSLQDVLPMSGARVTRDGSIEDPWTMRGPGGAPYLTVVASAAEALELVDDDSFSVVAVVGRMRPGTTDAASIVDIHRRGIPTLAMVPPFDRETLSVLDAAQLRFWVWDDAWLAALRWPPVSVENPLSRYESWLRKRDRAEVRVEPVEMPQLDDAWSHFKALEARRRSETGADDDDMLSIFVDAALSLFQLIRTTVTPPDETLSQELDRRSSRMKQSLQSGVSWWVPDVAATARELAVVIEGAAAQVRGGGPKWDLLRAWLGANPDGTVICGASTGARITHALAPATVSWMPAARAIEVTSALVPCWSSAEKMDHLLSTPPSSRLVLLLCGAELEWFDVAKRRRQQSERLLKHLAAKASPFRALFPFPTVPSAQAAEPLNPPSDPSTPLPDVYGYVARSRRTRLLSRVDADPSDRVVAWLVHFAGGVWAPYARDSYVHTITHLLLSEAETRRELRETPACELQVGDVVVLIRGSGRDVIRATVDEYAPPGLRERAGVWRRALLRYAATHDVEQILDRLREAGCRRTQSTVARWLTDESVIRLRHNRSDVEAIARITRDDELLSCLDSCVQACDELFTMHGLVGKDLTERVLEKVRDWIARGITPDEVIEIDSRIVVATVDSVDAESITVPRALLGRVQENLWPE